MVAEIASGNTDVADILFLIAVILFVVGAAVAWSASAFYATLISVGLGCCALAWLLL